MKKSLIIINIVLFLSGFIHLSAQIVTNLSIVASGKQLFIFWPASDSNYVLQKATSVNSSNWTVVASGSPLIGICTTNTLASQFFQLYMKTNIPVATAQIPGGTFTMGDTLDDEGDATPVSATVSSFYMDINLVSYGQWLMVYNWASSHGYGFVDSGSGKATNYPVESVDWYDAVKWSNARSQQAGLTPVYYSDAGMSQVYTNGEITPYVKWTANGYRLPTEAEWEMAARSGINGQRFPWGDTISDLVNANYYGYPAFLLYDIGPSGFTSFFSTGTVPFTSPEGFYPANSFGLYDMAGNVNEWCWDWYGTPYAGGTNPEGPANGTYRVMRGGDWQHSAQSARCACRGSNDPTFATSTIGFRCVKGP